MGSFSPPPLSSDQGFVPPPLSSHQGPADRSSSITQDFLKYSPVGAVKGIADALRELGGGHNPLKGAAEQNATLLDKAKDSFHKGDYTAAAAHFLNYLMPGGQAMEDAGEDFQNGEYAHGLAKTAGIASTMVAGDKAPSALDAATDLRLPAANPAVLERGIAATSPQVGRAALESLPHGQKIVDAWDKLKSGYKYVKAGLEAERKASQPPAVVRESPAWADIQPSPVQVPDFQPTPATALPSGRIPGNGQPQPIPEAVMELARKGLLKRSAAMPPEAPPAPPVQAPPVATTPAPAPQPVLTVRDLAQMPAKQARAALIAQQLRDEMLKNGSITEGNLTPPEEPDPAALRDMMRGDAVRDLPAGSPKAIAKANYAGNQEPKTAAAVYQAAGRAEKATSLAQMLYDEGVTENQIGKWSKADWEKAASDRGMKPFSKASQEEVLFRLRRLRAKDTATPQPPGGIQ